MLVYVGMHTPDSGQPLKNTGKYGYKMEFLEASKTELVASFLHPLVQDFLVQNFSPVSIVYNWCSRSY